MVGAEAVLGVSSAPRWTMVHLSFADARAATR